MPSKKKPAFNLLEVARSDRCQASVSRLRSLPGDLKEQLDEVAVQIARGELVGVNYTALGRALFEEMARRGLKPVTTRVFWTFMHDLVESKR